MQGSAKGRDSKGPVRIFTPRKLAHLAKCMPHKLSISSALTVKPGRVVYAYKSELGRLRISRACWLADLGKLVNIRFSDKLFQKVRWGLREQDTQYIPLVSISMVTYMLTTLYTSEHTHTYMNTYIHMCIHTKILLCALKYNSLLKYIFANILLFINLNLWSLIFSVFR